MNIQADSIAIVTCTLYKNWYPGKLGKKHKNDKIRGDLALKTISLCTSNSYQVVVVDSGSSKQFLVELNMARINFIDDPGETYGSSRRKGYALASKLPRIKVIVWTEAEKAPLINSSLLSAAELISSKHADIVIPRRTKAALLSLPPVQAASEEIGNNLFRENLENTLGHKLPAFDIFFGPKIFANRPEILNLFLTIYSYKEGTPKKEIAAIEQWSNSLTLPLVAALLADCKIASCDVDYIHPKEQTEIEMGNRKFEQKRKHQLSNLIKAEKQLIMYFENPLKSPLTIARRQ